MKINSLDRIRGYLVPGIALFASIAGLLVDVPAIFQTKTARSVLVGFSVLMIVYMIRSLYNNIIREMISLRTRLDNIKQLIVKFASQHENTACQDTIDLDLINLLTTTQSLRDLVVNITEIRVLAQDRVEIVIDKGHIDGFLDGMCFKVFQRERMQEIGTCQCTPAYDRATLLIIADPNCPVPLQEIRKEALEVHMIEPEGHSPVNHLIAAVLHEIDQPTVRR
jgi:hypothetical protein